MTEMTENIDRDELVDFTRKLIQTPSPSGEERAAAELTAREMHRLDFDRVHIDEMSNVIGQINPGGAPTVMFNGHIDCAAVGRMSDPYSAQIEPGESYGRSGPVIRGRGACDMKGAVAAMVHAAASLKKADPPPRGAVIVTAVALEERGEGEGTRYALRRGIDADFAICGEATDLRVHIGHRGKFNIRVTARGRTAHASDPERGRNAIFAMERFLRHLRHQYQPPTHEILGDCTYTAVDISARPGAESPIVPDECALVIDRRTLPGETKESVLAELQEIANSVRRRDPEFRADMEIITDTSPLLVSPEEPVVEWVQAAREQVLRRRDAPGAWRFGTDAPYINAAGIPCVGLGPGDESFAHTEDDHLPIEDLLRAGHIYARILENHCR